MLKNGELTTLKVANGNDAVNLDIEATLTGVKDHDLQPSAMVRKPLALPTSWSTLLLCLRTVAADSRAGGAGYVTSILDTKDMATGTTAQQALLAENSAGRTDGVWIKPDATPALESAATVRKHSNRIFYAVSSVSEGLGLNRVPIVDDVQGTDIAVLVQLEHHAVGGQGAVLSRALIHAVGVTDGLVQARWPPTWKPLSTMTKSTEFWLMTVLSPVTRPV